MDKDIFKKITARRKQFKSALDKINIYESAEEHASEHIKQEIIKLGECTPNESHLNVIIEYLRSKFIDSLISKCESLINEYLKNPSKLFEEYKTKYEISSNNYNWAAKIINLIEQREWIYAPHWDISDWVTSIKTNVETKYDANYIKTNFYDKFCVKPENKTDASIQSKEQPPENVPEPELAPAPEPEPAPEPDPTECPKESTHCSEAIEHKNGFSLNDLIKESSTRKNIMFNRKDNPIPLGNVVVKHDEEFLRIYSEKTKTKDKIKVLITFKNSSTNMYNFATIDKDQPYYVLIFTSKDSTLYLPKIKGSTQTQVTYSIGSSDSKFFYSDPSQFPGRIEVAVPRQTPDGR